MIPSRTTFHMAVGAGTHVMQRKTVPVLATWQFPQARGQWARHWRVVRLVALSVLMTLSAGTPQAAARSQPRICQPSCPGA